MASTVGALIWCTLVFAVVSAWSVSDGFNGGDGMSAGMFWATIVVIALLGLLAIGIFTQHLVRNGDTR